MKVVLAKDTHNPKGLPDLWPREIYSDDTDIDKPFITMSKKELESYGS